MPHAEGTGELGNPSVKFDGLAYITAEVKGITWAWPGDWLAAAGYDGAVVLDFTDSGTACAQVDDDGDLVFTDVAIGELHECTADPDASSVPSELEAAGDLGY